MDLIVRQAAEAGADEIVPFCSEYSAPGGQRLERWERIIREARQQSGSAVETRIRQPAKFAEALAYWQDKWEKNGVGIMFHQTPLAENSLHEYLYKYPAAASAAVGPEGGFSPGETEAFIGAGFKPAFLGPGVLRAETAAITALAAIKIILMERWSWKLKISGI
jgi:16S rRNA (uracil1498-N3)-methyltransferase